MNAGRLAKIAGDCKKSGLITSVLKVYHLKVCQWYDRAACPLQIAAVLSVDRLLATGATLFKEPEIAKPSNLAVITSSIPIRAADITNLFKVEKINSYIEIVLTR
jgi:hypothetical protein